MAATIVTCCSGGTSTPKITAILAAAATAWVQLILDSHADLISTLATSDIYPFLHLLIADRLPERRGHGHVAMPVLLPVGPDPLSAGHRRLNPTTPPHQKWQVRKPTMKPIMNGNGGHAALMSHTNSDSVTASWVSAKPSRAAKPPTTAMRSHAIQTHLMRAFFPLPPADRSGPAAAAG